MAFYECKDIDVPRAIITCDCAGECTEIQLMNDNDPEQYYLSIQPRGGFKNSFWHRLKVAWKVLMTGELYEDCMTIDVKTMSELEEWLRKHNNSG